MSWINLNIDVQVETNKDKKDIVRAIRKGIYRELDTRGVASPLNVKMSLNFRDKDQLFYMITDLGNRSEVELFYEDKGNIKPSGHHFYIHSYMIGTEQGYGYIDCEIRYLLEETNEEGMYNNSWTQMYKSFEDLPKSTQDKVSSVINETMTIDEQLLALDEIGIAADPSLDGSVGYFRLKY